MAAQALNENDPFFFLVVGALDSKSAALRERAEIQALINQSSPGNCFFHLARVPDGTQYNSWIACSDVLFAVYEEFYHSSNALTKAAAFGKPIVVANGYCAAERARAFDLGQVVPEADPKACLCALRKIFGIGSGQSPVVPSPLKQREYLSAHSYSRLKEVLGQIVTVIRSK